MAPSLTSHRPGLAITLKLSSILLFSIMAALIKASSDAVPPGEAVFFRSFFAIPVILIWIAARGELRSGLVTERPMMHFWRGVIGTSSMGLTFAGLGLLPLPEVTAIDYATPMLVLVLAAVMLGEKIRMIRISAVVIGMVGVLIMLWPRLGSTTADSAATLGAMLILGATALKALVQIHIRRMVETERTSAIVFYFSSTAAALALVTIPFGWVMPDALTATQLVTAGLVGGGAQILLTSSYRFAPASMLTPYEYSSMLFAILIGFLWFDEVPTLIMLAGAALVIAGNVLVAWREHQLGLTRAKVRAVSDPKG